MISHDGFWRQSLNSKENSFVSLHYYLNLDIKPAGRKICIILAWYSLSYKSLGKNTKIFFSFPHFFVGSCNSHFLPFFLCKFLKVTQVMVDCIFSFFFFLFSLLYLFFLTSLLSYFLYLLSLPSFIFLVCAFNFQSSSWGNKDKFSC